MDSGGHGIGPLAQTVYILGKGPKQHDVSIGKELQLLQFVDIDSFLGVESKRQTKVNVFNHVGALRLVILTH